MQAATRPNEIHFGRCYYANNNRNANINDNYSHTDTIDVNVRGVDGAPPAGIRGNEFGSLYSASKFALEGFSESLAKELEPFGMAMVHLAGQPRPPMRFAAGAFAVHIARTKFIDMLAELENYEKAAVATDFTR